jgi:hypothetical protein
LVWPPVYAAYTLVGVGATAYWLFLWCWAWFGADIDAVGTGNELQESRKGGTTYLVRYEYRSDGVVKSGSSGVSFAAYPKRMGEVDHEKMPVVCT